MSKFSLVNTWSGGGILEISRVSSLLSDASTILVGYVDESQNVENSKE